MAPIGLRRWLLGDDRTDRRIAPPVELAPPPFEPPAPVVQVACPNCGVVLDPPPDHTRLCPRCRHRIVVRHAEGRAIYLTEAAVEVFETERQHEIDQRVWARARRDWLHLARLAGAPVDRRERLARAPLTAAAVESSKRLYLVAAERAVRVARREKRWDDVARIRRRQAAALFEAAGGTPPPSDPALRLHREAAAAALRALALVSREAELVGASCCAACRADNEKVFRIVDELRVPRLPHADCPRGLCECDWWPSLRTPARKRRGRASTAPETAAGPGSTAVS